MLVGAMTASAQSFSDYFEVSYNGQAIADGETVIISDFVDYSTDGLGFWYMDAHLKMVNKTNEPKACFAILNYVGDPTKDQAQSDNLKWGVPSICYSGAEAYDSFSAGGCMTAGTFDAGNGTVWVPAAGTDTFQWEPHLEGCAPETVSNYRLTLVYMEGMPDEDLEESDCVMNINLKFTPDTNAVADIYVDNNDVPVYYDLLGNKVNNPENGIFVKVANGKAVKVAL